MINHPFAHFRTPALPLSRRDLLKRTSLGLIVGFVMPLSQKTLMASTAETSEHPHSGTTFEPNAFVRVAPDNTITVYIKHIEFGQGANTGLASLVAEEMDAAWDQMRAESAPANAELYKNLNFGLQGVGGSTGMANSYQQLRQAGAIAKVMLVNAAAKQWSVSPTEIEVSEGTLKHSGSGKEATFGAMAEAASRETVPGDAPLKRQSEFRFLGKNLQRLDTPAKANGKALFTIDMYAPNMLTVVVVHPPLFGARVTSFDASKALGMKNVEAVKQIPEGIAVYASDYWSALQAARKVEVKWENSQAEQRSTEDLIKEYRELAKSPGTMAHAEGDVESGFSNGGETLEAEYIFPYLAHAPMETMDCYIEPAGDGVRAAFGCQMQTPDKMNIAKTLGLKPAQVTLETLFGGGSFGRRAQQNSDIAVEAAHIFKAIGANRPIKFIHTREDDIQGGFYRPLYVHRLRANVKEKSIVSWDQTIVGQSIVAGSPFSGMIVDGVDPTSVEGAKELPYETQNRRLTLHTTEVGVPVLWWRSVGSTHTAYSVETFLDEIIEKVGGDPVATRLEWLKQSPRDAAVLEAVAKMAKWKENKVIRHHKGNKHALGVAVHKSFGSYVAQIAEVTKDATGMPKVTKVWCAIDCGFAVNPDIVVAQMEGGIGYGLGAILYNEITLDKGKVQQTNFDTYRPLRMADMPEIEVTIVNSGNPPTGVGEPGTPPIMPAVANAWYALTGQRIYRTPFSRQLQPDLHSANT